MNIQDLKSNTTWQEASNTINNNNNKISLAIATLENATLKNKGYFTTVEKLNEAVPNPTIGSKAYVGTSEPYAIYIVENGVWVDSGYTGGDEIVAKITTDRIENGAVTTDKIATSAFDSTLSVSGKIAPADVVGEKITELKEKVDALALGAFYGYFPDSASLPTDVTTSGYAYVGLDNPYKIWNFDGVSWSDSGTSIDMNDADEEDITRNTDGKLQFKNRAYGDGMGYVILRKNKTFAEQVTQANTIYEIRYNFDLGGESVEIPSDCVLYFKGGQLTSGNITGYDTILNYNSPFLSNVILNGSFRVNKDIVKDTDIFIDSNFNTNRIKSVLNVYSNSARIEFTKAIYNDITSIKVSRNIDVNFNESIINLYVNPSTSLADNFLYMEKHSRDFGSVLDFVKVKNVVIKGNPNCVYDGTSSFIGTGDYRRAIQLFNVDYVKLENVTLSNFSIGSSGTYAQSWADRYELSSISIFYYNKVELMNLEIHDCKSDNHVMLVPNINPNNKAIVEGCKCYNTYTGLLAIFDGRCEVYDCIVKDFYSSAFNLFCYDSLIHNNTFINGSGGACIDLTEGGEYLSKDIKIYNNYNKSLYLFCIISGKNIVVDNNYSDGGIAVSYCYPKTNVSNSENNPSFEDFGNFVISNNNFISSDSVIAYYGSNPTFINDRHIESFYIKGNIIKCTNPNFSLSGEHSPIVLVALENVIVDSNTLIGYGKAGVSSIYGSIISIGGNTGVGSFGYLIVSNNIISYTPTDGKRSYFIAALYVSDNYTISVKNNELLSDFTSTLHTINTIINVKSSGNINAPDLIDKHVNMTNLNFVLEKGESSYNVSANKPIWWTGTKWVDANGTDV